ncbi:hypothetical protein LWI28_018690 [Acer negundo]|uniref:Uncharacterized protein n=1 Tax=Acer negundo TaxID=4023 RepID=A0AAD5IN70_ACENE|nr:hypothetical protein LWI28_018690 [Acer negundo]
MSDSPASSTSDSASITSVHQTVRRIQQNTDGSQVVASESRHWRDIFWLGIFILHLAGLGFVLAVFGLNRFKISDRLNIDRYTEGLWENSHGLTETYWPMYALAGGVGTILGWIWLLLLGSHVNQMMKVSVHILTTYLAVLLTDFHLPCWCCKKQ